MGVDKDFASMAKRHAFTTTLLCLRLQGAALVATGFATREQFLQVAGDAYDGVMQMQADDEAAYAAKFDLATKETP